MATNNGQSFDAIGDYVVRKPIRFNGQDFVTGDIFPWQELSCQPRRLRQLVEGRFILPAPEPPKPLPLFDPTTCALYEEKDEDGNDSETWIVMFEEGEKIRIDRKEARRLARAEEPVKIRKKHILEEISV